MQILSEFGGAMRVRKVLICLIAVALSACGNEQKPGVGLAGDAAAKIPRQDGNQTAPTPTAAAQLGIADRHTAVLRLLDTCISTGQIYRYGTTLLGPHFALSPTADHDTAFNRLRRAGETARTFAEGLAQRRAADGSLIDEPIETLQTTDSHCIRMVRAKLHQDADELRESNRQAATEFVLLAGQYDRAALAVDNAYDAVRITFNELRGRRTPGSAAVGKAPAFNPDRDRHKAVVPEPKT